MNGWGLKTGDVLGDVSNIVDRLFDALKLHHTKERAYKALGIETDSGALEIKKAWCAELVKIPRKLVLNAGVQAKSERFCPTLGAFLDMCLPTAEQAYDEAVIGFAERRNSRNFEFTCAAVFFTAQEFDGVLVQDGYRKNASRWDKAWLSMLEKQSRGELYDIPAVEKRLPEPDYKTAKPAPNVQKFISETMAKVKNPPESWAMRLKSVAAAKMLIEASQKPENKGRFDSAIERNIKVGKLTRSDDGRLIVGSPNRFEYVTLTYESS